MSNYKTVRLEERVYLALLSYQHPRESLSQVIERLLTKLDELQGHIAALYQVIGGDK